MNGKKFLRRYWFLILMAVVIPIGGAYPEGGRWIRNTPLLIKSLVAITLGISGFTLDTSRLLRQAINVRAILLTLGATYVLTPLLAWGLAALWAPAEPEGEQFFHLGMMILAAQAGTLASALALTMVSRGDQELALVLTILSNSLTVLLTPFILNLSVGAEVSFEVGEMVLEMAKFVLLPVALGQLLRRFLWDAAKPLLPVMRIVPQLIILVFVYTGFASAASHLVDEPALALRYFGACALLHIALLVWNWNVARFAGLDVKASTAVTYCGSQKTMPNGIYVWNEFFAHNPYGAVPLVLYHILQLVVDTLILPFFERRNAGTRERP
jgi:sodium/bile acid cotransporter 7